MRMYVHSARVMFSRVSCSKPSSAASGGASTWRGSACSASTAMRTATGLEPRRLRPRPGPGCWLALPTLPSVARAAVQPPAAHAFSRMLLLRYRRSEAQKRKRRGAPHADLAQVRTLVPRALIDQLAICAGVLLRVQLHMQAPQVRRERLSRGVQMQHGCLRASERLCGPAAAGHSAAGQLR